ncbi:uncharacterized protein LOC102349589 [Latimeria chalumnae]|uniref:uncharacterized protein LOC102349589 n=1 Tax=Latimeria chalumnae TaxID=7897 RepID=UPI0003C1366A|nr:PREDICTED: uncharacterized protein LOC102349589 [Latimeria chalumnae]XP_005986303.1 PREDICTED: uncharacterized protein LOC102349589 [Latimeria chalumnae]|eukprot:XP_005986302.1 PREDICTED: uncharacterized protein LOC102349589 [Latimeria chalumnae]
MDLRNLNKYDLEQSYRTVPGRYTYFEQNYAMDVSSQTPEVGSRYWKREQKPQIWQEYTHRKETSNEGFCDTPYLDYVDMERQTRKRDKDRQKDMTKRGERGKEERILSTEEWKLKERRKEFKERERKRKPFGQEMIETRSPTQFRKQKKREKLASQIPDSVYEDWGPLYLRERPQSLPIKKQTKAQYEPQSRSQRLPTSEYYGTHSRVYEQPMNHWLGNRRKALVGVMKENNQNIYSSDLPVYDVHMLNKDRAAGRVKWKDAKGKEYVLQQEEGHHLPPYVPPPSYFSPHQTENKYRAQEGCNLLPLKDITQESNEKQKLHSAEKTDLGNSKRAEKKGRTEKEKRLDPRIYKKVMTGQKAFQGYGTWNGSSSTMRHGETAVYSNWGSLPRSFIPGSDTECMYDTTQLGNVAVESKSPLTQCPEEVSSKKNKKRKGGGTGETVFCLVTRTNRPDPPLDFMNSYALPQADKSLSSHYNACKTKAHNIRKEEGRLCENWDGVTHDHDYVLHPGQYGEKSFYCNTKKPWLRQDAFEQKPVDSYAPKFISNLPRDDYKKQGDWQQYYSHGEVNKIKTTEKCGYNGTSRDAYTSNPRDGRLYTYSNTLSRHKGSIRDNYWYGEDRQTGTGLEEGPHFVTQFPKGASLGEINLAYASVSDVCKWEESRKTFAARRQPWYPANELSCSQEYYNGGHVNSQEDNEGRTMQEQSSDTSNKPGNHPENKHKTTAENTKGIFVIDATCVLIRAEYIFPPKKEQVKYLGPAQTKEKEFSPALSAQESSNVCQESKLDPSVYSKDIRDNRATSMSPCQKLILSNRQNHLNEVASNFIYYNSSEGLDGCFAAGMQTEYNDPNGMEHISMKDILEKRATRILGIPLVGLVHSQPGLQDRKDNAAKPSKSLQPIDEENGNKTQKQNEEVFKEYVDNQGSPYHGRPMETMRTERKTITGNSTEQYIFQSQSQDVQSGLQRQRTSEEETTGVAKESLLGFHFNEIEGIQSDNKQNTSEGDNFDEKNRVVTSDESFPGPEHCEMMTESLDHCVFSEDFSNSLAFQSEIHQDEDNGTQSPDDVANNEEVLGRFYSKNRQTYPKDLREAVCRIRRHMAPDSDSEDDGSKEELYRRQELTFEGIALHGERHDDDLSCSSSDSKSSTVILCGTSEDVESEQKLEDGAVDIDAATSDAKDELGGLKETLRLGLHNPESMGMPPSLTHADLKVGQVKMRDMGDNPKYLSDTSGDVQCQSECDVQSEEISQSSEGQGQSLDKQEGMTLSTCIEEILNEFRETEKVLFGTNEGGAEINMEIDMQKVEGKK